jgi:hypothetical protein
MRDLTEFDQLSFSAETRFSVKLAIQGQREVDLLGQLRSTGSPYEQPIGGFPVVKQFAILRQRQHVGADITEGAQHPAVLGRETGRERLGQIVRGKTHLRIFGWRPLSGQPPFEGCELFRSSERLSRLTHPGDVVFRHACKMGLEGIVSKRLASRYRSGRSPDWLKFKNPDAPAVKREAEEDWTR